MPHPWELLVRVIIGTALGGVIGYERHFHRRPAGFRTHLIVALASATFMVVSTDFVYFQAYGRADLVAVDPSRIAASVVTGIGFLAGGAILRSGLTVQGLTTAASLWLVTAIGLSSGAGMYAVSVLATALGVMALTILRRVEGKDDQLVRRKISLVLGEGAPAISEIVASVAEMGVVPGPADYEKRVDENRIYVTFEARLDPKNRDRLVQRLESHPGLLRVRIESLP